LGNPPDVALIEQLYNPPVPYELLPDVDEENEVYRLRIEGVLVRYVETRGAIKVTVEGELPEATLKILQDDLCEKLSLLENTECQVVIDG
jgi:hypothetical protein